MNSLFNRAAAAAATLGLAFAPLATHAMTTTAFGPGDLIKSSASNSVYYYASNGKRYVFPNDKTYFTWYKDFATVKTIPAGLLSTISIGGNVTYRPGVKMVKITTDSKTYAVDGGGVLRHIGTEQLAQTLFGPTWQSRIDDVPDAFFGNYKIGTAIGMAGDFKPADVMNTAATISMDKQLDPTKMTISIGSVDNGFVPSSLTVKKGTTVTWTNYDGPAHNVSINGQSSGDLDYNKDYSYTFNTVGSFNYNDTIHPVMKGTVNVVN